MNDTEFEKILEFLTNIKLIHNKYGKSRLSYLSFLHFCRSLNLDYVKLCQRNLELRDMFFKPSYSLKNQGFLPRNINGIINN